MYSISRKRTLISILIIFVIYSGFNNLFENSNAVLFGQSIESANYKGFKLASNVEKYSYQNIFDLPKSSTFLTDQSDSFLSGFTPILYEIQKVTSDDNNINASFGTSVALDGNTLVVGSPASRIKGIVTGAVYIFIRNGNSWVQQAKLIANDGANDDLFGLSVAIQGDVIIIGSPYDDDNIADSGSAYIFTRNGTIWTQRTKLTANDPGNGDFFGGSVDIDENTIVVGAGSDDNNENFSHFGSVYVFTGNDANWKQQAKLTADNPRYSHGFGYNLCLDNNKILIGVSGDDDNGGDSGAAYLFERNNQSWSQIAKLTANDGASQDNLGRSVSLEGDTAVVGATGDDDNGDGSGSAYIFTKTGSTWTQQGKLIASNGVMYDQFGSQVSIFKDTVAIGSIRGNSVEGTTGAIYVYTRNESTWSEYRKLHPFNANNSEQLGYSIAMQGNTIIGGVGVNSFSQKSVYYYNLLGSTAKANISGRIVVPHGVISPPAIVQIIKKDGDIQKTTTNQFGYFRFNNIEIGQRLIMTSFHKKYLFDSREIDFIEEINNFTITPR